MENYSIKSDFYGIASACLCVVHCMLTPVILAVNHFQAFGTAIFWECLNYVFLIISFYAVYNCSYSNFKSLIKIIQYILLSGLAFYIVFHEHITIPPIISYLLSFGLVISHFVHIINHRKTHE
ncbi:MAG: hypothetical protein EAZ07_02600 [Cytophagales bacterium]|nr:MAG: hypothetical protein EAZ07_02600 [Cytophagales bacterium]